MEKLETIEQIKEKLNKGIQLNISESSVLIDVIDSKKIRLKDFKVWKGLMQHKFKVTHRISKVDFFEGTILECDAYVRLKQDGYMS